MQYLNKKEEWEIEYLLSEMQYYCINTALSHKALKVG